MAEFLQFAFSGLTVGAIVAKSRAFSQWQPKISANYKINDNFSVFADWGIGFKAGGFNSQGSAAVIDTNLNAPLGSAVLINDDYKKVCTFQSDEDVYKYGEEIKGFHHAITGMSVEVDQSENFILLLILWNRQELFSNKSLCSSIFKFTVDKFNGIKLSFFICS